MGRTTAFRKDHPNPLNHAQLHEHALTISTEISPDDESSRRYADAAAALIAGHTPAHRRPATWVSTLHGYEAFWEAHGRTPRENTRARHTLTADERHLGEWARYQRRFEDHLTVYQRARLEVSPAFAWDLRGESWERNLTACHAHRQRTGGLPRLNGNDRDEYALARWLGRQMRRLQLGQLDRPRLEQLQALLASPPSAIAGGEASCTSRSE